MHYLFLTAIVINPACTGSAPQNTPSSSGDQADDGTPRLACPEGTQQQSATTESGEEYWCARGGIMHGPFLSFHENGERAASGTWIDNQRSGQWTWWYPNAQTKQKGKYDRGKQIGSWQWWHDNGKRQMEGDFLLGRKQGQWTTFFASGHRESQGMYHNDQMNEIWNYFEDDDTDKIVRKDVYKNGALVDDKKK
ncbi:MAG: hypothetical protein AAF602_22430 [Myxococcota bacterium]